MTRYKFVRVPITSDNSADKRAAARAVHDAKKAMVKKYGVDFDSLRVVCMEDIEHGGVQMHCYRVEEFRGDRLARR
jgi:hypothetical protein